MRWKDHLPGGRADRFSPKDFNQLQLKKGIMVEMEHTGNPVIAMEIAMDHLTEDPKYYDHLLAMEAKHAKKHMPDLRIPSADLQAIDALLGERLESAYMLLAMAGEALESKQWSAASIRAIGAAVLAGKHASSAGDSAKHVIFIAIAIADHAARRKKLQPIKKRLLDGFLGGVRMGVVTTFTPQTVGPHRVFGLGNTGMRMSVPMQTLYARKLIDRAQAAIYTGDHGAAAEAAARAKDIAESLRTKIGVAAMDIIRDAEAALEEAESMDPGSMIRPAHRDTPVRPE